MKKTIVGFLAAALFAPVAVFAFDADCHNTTTGCTIADLIGQSNQQFYSVERRVSFLQEAIQKLVAQIAQIQDPISEPGHEGPNCFVPTYDLYIGRTDAQTNGEVSRLQLWLKGQGVFPDAQGTGYYGEKTAAAVMKWQKAHGMDFVTLTSGVGKQTRAKMQAQCAAGR